MQRGKNELPNVEQFYRETDVTELFTAPRSRVEII